MLSATPVETTYPVPANGALFGLAASAQMVAVDPVTLRLRWSNVQSMVLID